MYISWWVWAYAYTHDTITTTKVLNISNTSKTYLVFLCVCVCVLVRTFYMRSILFTNFKLHNTLLLTMLHSRVLELTHLCNRNFVPNEKQFLISPFPQHFIQYLSQPFYLGSWTHLYFIPESRSSLNTWPLERTSSCLHWP